jgi:hypothetical protein
MPITIEERWAGRKRTAGTRSSANIGYWIFGTDDDTEAKEALLTDLPATWDGLVLDDCDVNQVNDQQFEAVAKYLDEESKAAKDEAEKQVKELQQPEDESEFNFEIGSASQHVTHSIQTTGSYSRDGFALSTIPSFNQAIGVTVEGSRWNIAGVDIDVGSFSFSRKKVFAAIDVTPEYIDFLFRLRRKTNAQAFGSFAAGEVRFMGASGKLRKDGNYEITFRFEASPHVENLTIGSITGISKGGWEYLWVYSQPVKDASGHLVPTPVAVYTERVFENDGDFSSIGV